MNRVSTAFVPSPMVTPEHRFLLIIIRKEGHGKSEITYHLICIDMECLTSYVSTQIIRFLRISKPI
jgi:hypothetical protein